MKADDRAELAELRKTVSILANTAAGKLAIRQAGEAERNRAKVAAWAEWLDASADEKERLLLAIPVGKRAEFIGEMPWRELAVGLRDMTPAQQAKVLEHRIVHDDRLMVQAWALPLDTLPPRIAACVVLRKREKASWYFTPAIRNATTNYPGLKIDAECEHVELETLWVERCKIDPDLREDLASGRLTVRHLDEEELRKIAYVEMIDDKIVQRHKAPEIDATALADKIRAGEIDDMKAAANEELALLGKLAKAATKNPTLEALNRIADGKTS